MKYNCQKILYCTAFMSFIYVSFLSNDAAAAVTFKSAGECMTLGDDTSVSMEECDDTNSRQGWDYNTATKQIKSAHNPTLCVSAIQPRARVGVSACDDTSKSQKWTRNGPLFSSDRYSEQDQVLDYFEAAGRPGTWPRHGNYNQQWVTNEIDGTPQPQQDADGFTVMRPSGHGGKSVAVYYFFVVLNGDVMTVIDRGTVIWASNDNGAQTITIDDVSQHAGAGLLRLIILYPSSIVDAQGYATVTTLTEGGNEGGARRFTVEYVELSKGTRAFTVKPSGDGGEKLTAYHLAYRGDDPTAIADGGTPVRGGAVTWTNGDTGARTVVLNEGLSAGTQGTLRLVLLAPSEINVIDAGGDGLGFTSGSFEWNQGTSTFTVKRPSGIEGAISVYYSVLTEDDSGNVNEISSGTIRWMDGDTGDKYVTIADSTRGILRIVLSWPSPQSQGSFLYITVVTVSASGGVVAAENAKFNRDTGVIIIERSGGSDGTKTVRYQILLDRGSDGVPMEQIKRGEVTWKHGDSAEKVVVINNYERHRSQGSIQGVLSPLAPSPVPSPAPVPLSLPAPSSGAQGGGAGGNGGDSGMSDNQGSSSSNIMFDRDTGTFTIPRPDGSEGMKITANWKVFFTANDGTKQRIGSGTSVWEPGDTTGKTITGADYNHPGTQGTLSIEVQWSSSASSASQTGSGSSSSNIVFDKDTGTFTIPRPDGSEEMETTLKWKVFFTASGGAKKEIGSGTLVWESGDTTGKTITRADYNHPGTPGTLSIEVQWSSSASSASQTGSVPSGSVTTEQTGSSDFSVRNVVWNQATKILSFTVRRNSGGATTVRYEVHLLDAAGTGRAGILGSGQLTWPDGGSNAQLVTMNINGWQSGRSIQIVLSYGGSTQMVRIQFSSQGGQIQGQAQSTASAPLVKLVRPGCYITEGVDATLEVRRVADTCDANSPEVTVFVRVGSDTARVEEDFESSGKKFVRNDGHWYDMVTFPKGDCGEKTYTVSVKDDGVAEPDETVYIGAYPSTPELASKWEAGEMIDGSEMPRMNASLILVVRDASAGQCSFPKRSSAFSQLP